MAAIKNPQGPKAEKPWREAVQRAVRRKMKGEGQPQRLDLLADKVVALGLEGDISAIKEIGDRLDGKPPVQAAVTVDGSLTVNLVRFADDNDS